MPLIILRMLIRLYALILGCFFLFVTPFVASAKSESERENSHRNARVIAPKAIVYSDENMNSPIGYIPNGKLIIVGRPRKKNPDLLSTVVYGRLAFIEAKNISLEEDSLEVFNPKRGAPREHDIDITLAKPEDKLSENNSAYLDIHRFSAGSEMSNIVGLVSDETKDSFLGFNISLIHRQLTGKFFWGAGYEYNSLSTSNFKYNLYMLGPVAGYTPIKNPLFLLDLTLAIDFSISAQMDIVNNFSNEPSGFVWGPQIGGRMVFFPDKIYHVFGSLSYRSYKIYGQENLKDSTDSEIGGITKMSGVNLAIGVAIEI